MRSPFRSPQRSRAYCHTGPRYVEALVDSLGSRLKLDRIGRNAAATEPHTMEKVRINNEQGECYAAYPYQQQSNSLVGRIYD